MLRQMTFWGRSLSEGRARRTGEPRASVAVDYVLVGLGVPIATFLGVWLWRLRHGPGHGSQDEAPDGGAELAQSVTAVCARLDELRDQVNRWSRDLDEQDRKLADRISGLIGRTEKAGDVPGRIAAARSDPRTSGKSRRGGA
jgi:hypothetical protein